MKIKVIHPVILAKDMDGRDFVDEVKSFFNDGTDFDIQALDYGPDSLETEYDTVMAAPDILRKVRKAEEEGYDGVFISCFDDPGVMAAREIVNIPVVGGFESSMLVAMGLGDKIGIVTVLADGLATTEHKIKQMSITDRVTSLRYVGIPVLELENREKLQEELYQESIKAITEDRAQVIVLGCTGMTNVANALYYRLKESGYDVPVIDPSFAAIQMLQVYIRMGIKQSKMMYMPPREKERRWWE